MRTLILTCNTGGGHNTCAKAIQQAFQNNGIPCEIADSLQFSSNILSRFLSWGHTTMYRHVPDLFRWGYGYAEQHPDAFQEDHIIYKLLSAGAERLYTYVHQGGYNTVICTHVFSGVLLAQMLREYPLNLKTAFVATDYTCSPGTAVSCLDLYFIPHESLSAEFESQGIPKDRIVASGIPVSRCFYDRPLKQQTKEALGISPSHSHLLMMCGSMGCGPMEELTGQLRELMDDTTKLTIVCGTNEKRCETLTELTQTDPRIHVLGFVTNMNELMDSADLYLTKPGGLSVTEAAAKQLPMVLIDAVAGCEAHNMRFFVERGGAVTADNPEALAASCISLMKNPDRLQTMASALSSLSEKPAAEVIFAAIREN